RRRERLGRQTGPLLAEQQQAALGQLGPIDRHRAFDVVHRDDGQAALPRPRDEVGEVGVVQHVLVAVGDHRPALVPPPAADDVHRLCQEGVGAAHDRTDVEVVLPVLDGDVEGMPAGIQVGDDRLHRPVAVAVDDVPPVAVGEQFAVVARIVRPRGRAAGPRAHTVPVCTVPCDGFGVRTLAFPRRAHASTLPPQDLSGHRNPCYDFGMPKARVLEREGVRRPASVPRLAWLIGPALVAGVAYLDPGNVASNMTAGARFGYLLVWVVVLGNVMAWLIQYLSAKLGVVTGESLPEVLGRRLRNRWGRRAYWLQAELVAMATDIAEVIGGAVALNLLFGLPLLWGGAITGAVSISLLLVQSRAGAQPFEFVVIGLVAIIAV